MPNKPDKFGMVLHCLVDYSTKYCYGIRLYLGKKDKIDGRFGEFIVKQLTSLLPKQEYLLACDQLFTTYALCEELWNSDIKVIGTIKKNSKDLPSICKRNPLNAVEKQIRRKLKSKGKEYQKHAINMEKLRRKTDQSSMNKENQVKTVAIPETEVKKEKKLESELLELKEKMKKVESRKKNNPKNYTFYTCGKVTLCNFNPSATRVCNIISSVPIESTVSKNGNISFINDVYNKCKTPVDTLDQVTKKYSCKRKVSRWNVKLIFDIIDIAASNSYACYSSKKTRIRRSNFLEMLAVDLAIPYLKETMKQKRRTKGRKHLQDLEMAELSYLVDNPTNLEKQVIGETPTPTPNKKTKEHCRFGDCKKRSTIKCDCCGEPVCGDHLKKVCLGCLD
ncbi:piggyBac transposable element-derived protein 4-like [Entamoeba marina]